MTELNHSTAHRAVPVWRKAASAGLAAAVLSTGLVGLVAPAANAAPVSIVEQTNPNSDPQNPATFWNKFTLSNRWVAFCVGDPQNPGPLNVDAYDDAQLQIVDGEYQAPSGGTAHWSEDAQVQAGYILAKYGQSGDAAAVQYAVMSLADPTYPDPWIRGSPRRRRPPPYLADAKANAAAAKAFQLGEPTITLDNEARTGTVKINASEKLDQDVKVTVTGATFKDGATEQTVNVKDATDLDLVIPEDAQAQDVTVSTEAAGVPETDFHVLASEEHQDLFIAGQTRDVKATGTAKFVPVIPPEVPTVASDDVEVGGDIWDTLKVTGDVPEGAYATVELHKLSDSTDQAEVLKDAKCTDETLVDHDFGRIEVTKAGEYTTSKFTTTEAGTYGFIETLHDANGKVLAKGKCGVESETVVVTPKPEKPVTPPTPEQPTPEKPVVPVTPEKPSPSPEQPKTE